jgi:hypothetical protein
MRVPEGRLKIAQDASPGLPDAKELVPLGTTEILCSCVQSSLRDSHSIFLQPI